MRRDLDRLTASTFDVLVVGGGIYGLTIACDAAQRGLGVALIEREDFGSGASFNHLRTIHGGLRYLQTLDLARARESVAERRTLARIAPHAVSPMPFVLPLYPSLTRGRAAMRAGFLLDRLVAADRNRGVPHAHRLPAGKVIARDAAIRQFPGLRRQGLTGAAVWYDYVTVESDRLTFAWALAAAESGAVLANHVEGCSVVRDGARVAGVRARDAVGSREFDIRARIIVNATGSDIDRLAVSAGGRSPAIPVLKAMNLVTKREAGGEALGGRSASGRNLFLVPWRGRALFGTWESGRAASPGDREAHEADIAAFIVELNQAFPSLDLTRGDVTLVHKATVPAVALTDGRVALDGHETIREEAEGLVSVAGAKYTTARRVAQRVTDLLLKRLGRGPVACRTGTAPLPGGSIGDVALAVAGARREFDERLPSDSAPHLVAAYGSRYRDVLKAAERRPELLNRIAADGPVIGAQLLWAAEQEMAVTLSDAVIRRTPLGALGRPSDETLRTSAEIVGGVLGWTPDRAREEIRAVERFYEI